MKYVGELIVVAIAFPWFTACSPVPTANDIFGDFLWLLGATVAAFFIEDKYDDLY